MRVLLTLSNANRYGGVQTFTRTLAGRLRHEGSDVAIYAPDAGTFFSALRAEGHNVTNDVDALVEFAPDVIHGQGLSAYALARARLPVVPAIFHAHGVLPAEEQPPSPVLAPRRYVAVSEEVRSSIIARVGEAVPVDVLWNPIDIDVFRPVGPGKKVAAGGTPTVLVTGRDLGREILQEIEEACTRLGVDMRLVGVGDGRQHTDLTGAYAGSDVVIGVGRSALEAMACGAAVVVLGPSGHDGVATESSWREFGFANFSGRVGGLAMEAGAIVDSLAQALDVGGGMRDVVVEHFGVDRYIARIEQIYREVVDAGRVQLEPAVPVRELLVLADKITKLAGNATEPASDVPGFSGTIRRVGGRILRAIDGRHGV